MEDDHVAAPTSQAQGVTRGQVNRLHPAGHRPQGAVGQLCKDRRHFEDTHAKLQDGRLVRPEPAARSHRCTFLPRPKALTNLVGVQNADNVPTAPQIKPMLRSTA